MTLSAEGVRQNEEFMQRLRRKREGQKQRLDLAADDIARALCDVDTETCWSVQAPGKDASPYRRLVADNGDKLGMRYDEYKDRWYIYGILPDYASTKTQITVNARRSGVSIASDIVRRLLPDFRPELVLRQQAINKEQARKDAVNLAIGELARLNPDWTVYPCDESGRTGRSRDEASVSMSGLGTASCANADGSILFELYSVPLEKAKRIVQILIEES